MSINENLAAINTSLTAASTEIVSELTLLEASVTPDAVVDSALLAEVRERTASLAQHVFASARLIQTVIPGVPPA